MRVDRLRSRFTWLRGQQAFQRKPVSTLARLAAWRVKTWTGTPGAVPLASADAVMFVPPEWHGMAKLAYGFRDLAEPELPVIGQLIPSGTIAIDAGAHYGDYTLTLSRAVGAAGQVWAVEPSERFLDICRANVGYNHMRNVRFFCVGLADAPGTARLVLPEDPSRSYVNLDTQAGEEIQLVALDDLMEQENPQDLPVSFIKLDIEGSELAAIRGAERTIRRWRPLLLVEFQNTFGKPSGHAMENLGAEIRDLGYRFRVYSWRARCWEPADPAQEGHANYLCVPDEVELDAAWASPVQ